MTSEEFWKDDPNLFLAYHTSFINKKKRAYEESNYNSWLQGLYIHESATIINSHLEVAINRSHGGDAQYDKKAKYPSKPYNLFENEEKKEKESKEEKQKEYYESYNYFATLKQRFVEKIEKGG